MTVGVETPTRYYNGDGSTTAFAPGFTYSAASDIVVTVSGASATWSLIGGNVVFASAPPVGTQNVKIARATPRAQSTTYGFNGNFSSAAMAIALDRAMRIAQEQDQQQADNLRRCLRVPDGETTVPLPAAAARKNTYLGFDAAGVPTPISASGSGATDAAFVNYLLNLTGAIGRSVANKLGDWVSAKDFGAVGDGSTDDAPAINAALATGARTVLLPRGTYLISGTLFVPAFTMLLGLGRDTMITPSATGTFTSGFAAMYNSTDGTNWISTYPQGPMGGFRNIYFNNFNGSSATKMIFTAGAMICEDLTFRAAKQCIVTSGLYDDMVTMRRIWCFEPRDSSFQIDLGQLGDSMVIEQCELATTDFDNRNSHIRVRASQGGVIRQVTQGFIYLQGCDGMTLENAHIERGNITLLGCNITVKDSYLWPQATVPSIDLVANGQYSTVKVENCSFSYNVNSGSGAYYGFDIRVDGGSHLIVDNCRRRTRGSNIETISNTGIKVSNAADASIADFNNYSWKLSLRGEVRRGGFVPLDLRCYGPEGTPSIFTQVQATYTTWLGTSGTFYYRVVKVLDPVRMCGKADANERSVALTNGGNGATLTVFHASDYMIRIYRGTATNSYDSYVDLPITNSGAIYDNGQMVNGYPWLSRSAGAADTYYDATEIAINNLCCRVTGVAKPTVGNFVVGDKFDKKTPTAAGYNSALCITAPTTFNDCNATV